MLDTCVLGRRSTSIHPFVVVLWKCWFGVGVWGVGTLLGFEEMTAAGPRRGFGGWCFLGAACCRVRWKACLVVVLVCCLRIV